MSKCFIEGIYGNVDVGVGFPDFTYTGEFEAINETGENWKIKFLSSGVLTINKLKGASKGIDVFLVGGGGGVRYQYSGGGGGGYTRTVKNIQISKGVYEIIIGAGGLKADGGVSEAFGQKASGGYMSNGSGANGGSGGGGYLGGSSRGGIGGSNGGDGGTVSGTDGKGGKGQISVPGPLGETGNTREFGEETGDLYAGGGGGGSTDGFVVAGGDGGGGATYSSGAANTGGGAGGNKGNNSNNPSGGSGIVIIRNARGT